MSFWLEKDLIKINGEVAQFASPRLALLSLEKR